MARRRRRNRGKGRSKDQRQKRNRGAALWGDADKLPDPVLDVRVAADPGLAVRSLGPPALPGREVIAEHYFEAVYARMAGVASALAVAGGMLDPEALTDGEDDED